MNCSKMPEHMRALLGALDVFSKIRLEPVCYWWIDDKKVEHLMSVEQACKYAKDVILAQQAELDSLRQHHANLQD